MNAPLQREPLRIWLEKGLNDEQLVYVETRHLRKVFALEEFVTLVREKLKCGRHNGGQSLCHAGFSRRQELTIISRVRGRG